MDPGADAVYVHRLRDGKLARHQRLVLPAKSGPRDLACHPRRSPGLPGVRVEPGGRARLGSRALTRLAGNVPAGGSWPRHLVLDGQWMYASNQRSGTVTWLPVGPVTGLPGAVQGSLTVPAVATVLLG
ncbi:MAG TPA: beta-propeller fold lactonase family protein [Amycolatopsis sp.]|uniref:beta-propeller fold lactonase family protein n=1 Tax=Amycolatopsis sp. TaxID=37632 RepID=UPI002B48C35F|nr:beta-propeller fold lactonase family protein [Amycolatopsis sp.]HKS43833.1 beta-propeller fold lactonase family protein [Amycolatopsis sp.]